METHTYHHAIQDFRLIDDTVQMILATISVSRRQIPTMLRHSRSEVERCNLTKTWRMYNDLSYLIATPVNMSVRLKSL